MEIKTQNHLTLEMRTLFQIMQLVEGQPGFRIPFFWPLGLRSFWFHCSRSHLCIPAHFKRTAFWLIWVSQKTFKMGVLGFLFPFLFSLSFPASSPSSLPVSLLSLPLSPFPPSPKRWQSRFKERADALRPPTTLFPWILGFSLSLDLNIWQGLILSPQLRVPLTVLWRMLWKCLRMSGWVSTAYVQECVFTSVLSV